MIIHRSLFARNTTELDTNTNTTSSAPPTTTTTTTHVLSHTNLVGVLVIAALLILGIILWLCFGKWSKPIRHFLRREPCSSVDGNGPAVDAAKKKKTRRKKEKDEVAPTSPALGRTDVDANADVDPEKAVMEHSGSCDCSLDQDAIVEVEVEVELTPPEKVGLR
jgi:hypothetical protein